MESLHISRDAARLVAAAVTTGQQPWRFVPPAKRTGKVQWPSPAYCGQVAASTVDFLRKALAQDELYKQAGYRSPSPAPCLPVADGWSGRGADVLEREAEALPDGGWQIRAWDARKFIVIRQPATGAAVVRWEGFPGLEGWLRPPIPAHSGPVRRF